MKRGPDRWRGKKVEGGRWYRGSNAVAMGLVCGVLLLGLWGGMGGCGDSGSGGDHGDGAVVDADRIDGALMDGASGQDGGDSGLRDGDEFVITGSGFGDKGGGTLFYDDFESGAIGQQVGGGWTIEGQSDQRAVYDDGQVWAGNGAALIDFPDGVWGNTMYLSHLDLDEVYVSYRVFVHDGGGTPHDGPQLKFARATSADTDVIHGDFSIGMTYVGAFGEGSATWFNGGSEVDGSFWGESPSTDSWVRIELYLRLSDPAGEANGVRWAKMNYGGQMTYSGYPDGHFADPYGTAGIGPEEYAGAPLITRPAELADTRIQNVVMPMFTRSEQVISVWVDEVYVDSTQARVEIGDAPRWYDCTDRSPQPVSSWTDGEIRIRLNQGRLSGDAYLFVVRPDGEILEQGLVGAWAQ